MLGGGGPGYAHRPDVIILLLSLHVLSLCSQSAYHSGAFHMCHSCRECIPQEGVEGVCRSAAAACLGAGRGGCQARWHGGCHAADRSPPPRRRPLRRWNLPAAAPAPLTPTLPAAPAPATPPALPAAAPAPAPPAPPAETPQPVAKRRLSSVSTGLPAQEPAAQPAAASPLPPFESAGLRWRL